jgi:signal transduction histidine kinase
MKLIHKTSRYYLSYTLFVLALGTVAFYFLIRTVLLDSVDEALHQEEIQLIENLRYEKSIDSLKPSENIYIRKVRVDHAEPERFSTIDVYDKERQRYVHYRQLKSIYRHNENFYEITVRQSLEEAETLLASLLPAVAGLFLFILIGVFFINTYISNKIWTPFYQLLDKLKGYEPGKTRIIPYTHSEVTEFNQLSQGIERMTAKIHKDFISQKEFNENSSHEMQTPLAIIRNKLELLVQSPNLSQEDSEHIQTVFNAVNRLSLLKKGLLLISKIENQQYGEVEKVEMEMLVRNVLKNYGFQIEDKKIKLTLKILDPCVLDFNIILADILINNLISNAIKHNLREGILHVELGKKYLRIENTGKPLKVSSETLFERFKKNAEGENSIGLGLSIVKKICELFKYKISYQNEGEIHIINIQFLES